MAHLTLTSYMRARRVNDSQDNLQELKRSLVVFDLNALDCHDLVLTDIKILCLVNYRTVFKTLT